MSRKQTLVLFFLICLLFALPRPPFFGGETEVGSLPPLLLFPAQPQPMAAQPLDVNTASEAQLQTLPGIGPVLARAIVEHRSRCGPFLQVDELAAVPGLGGGTLERIRPSVTVSQP